MSHMEQITESFPKITVRQSGIHGTGVYAAEPIAKGTRIIEYAGEKIPTLEGTKREEASPQHTFIFTLNDEWYIDARFGGNDSRFINHSCNPNTEADIENDRIWIVALRDITEGEELTYDYSFDPDDDPAPCVCGAASCRGQINRFAEAELNLEKDYK